MRLSVVITSLTAACFASSALPNQVSRPDHDGFIKNEITRHQARLYARATSTTRDPNPWLGKNLYTYPFSQLLLDPIIVAFTNLNETNNANKARTIRKISSFAWITLIKDLKLLGSIIRDAQRLQTSTGKQQMVGLVLYNLPGKDCSAGESAGELEANDQSLESYMHDFVEPFARELAAASDLNFAVVIEPDALGNLVSNRDEKACQEAASFHMKALAYAISTLQYEHVHLYVDAAGGRWLGTQDNLDPGKFILSPHDIVVSRLSLRPSSSLQHQTLLAAVALNSTHSC